MKKLVLETTSPFQGLAELVAYDEGLFAKEGIQIEWADRDEAGIKTSDTSIKDVKATNMFGSHGTLLEQGKADMYNACEWGNYCRAGGTNVGSQQVGRRAIIAYGAIVVRPDSPVYTPQQLAGRTVGVPFYAGTHALALQLLEGFLPRDLINVCSAPNGSRNRFDLMMKGEIEATTLTEPYITLAEKRAAGSSARDSSTAPRSPPTASTRKPMLRSLGRLRRRCGVSTPTRRLISTTSSTITRSATRRSAHSSWKTCVRVASWWSIPHRSRPMNYSAPTTG